MRLRQLGSTQSIAFVAPPEVYQSIIDLRLGHAVAQSPVCSVDVVRWLLEQSCRANKNMMPLHIAQGSDFCRRTSAIWKHANIRNSEERLKLLDAIQKREDLTLEQLYGSDQTNHDVESTQLDFESLQQLAARLQVQRIASLANDEVMPSSGFEEVEQQREVEFEVEQVHEKQTSLGFKALSFPGLHSAITRFVETGDLDHQYFLHALEFLGHTRIGAHFGVNTTSSNLFVSNEFSRTVKSDRYGTRHDVVVSTLDF